MNTSNLTNTSLLFLKIAVKPYITFFKENYTIHNLLIQSVSNVFHKSYLWLVYI